MERSLLWAGLHPWKALKKERDEDMTNYIVIDTETTDATSERGVCEVAFAIIDQNFNVIDERESIIDPEQMINPAASGIHGLTNADCESYPTLEEFFSVDDPSCYGKKLPGPAWVIGHRVSFDTHTLGKFIDGEVLELDTLRFARRLYPDAPDHKLSTLAYALNLPRPENSHRALSDVYTAMHLCKHICERTGMTLPQLAEVSKAPMEVPTVAFGKHKGIPFKDVPRSYLRWMKENMKDLDLDTAYTIDLHLQK